MEDLSKVLQEMQMLEYNLNSILIQRQTIQVELDEISHALSEIERSGQEEVFRVYSSFMIKVDRNKAKEDLEERKKIIQMRDSSFEKQEKAFLSKLEQLKDEAQKTISSQKE